MLKRLEERCVGSRFLREAGHGGILRELGSEGQCIELGVEIEGELSAKPLWRVD